MSLFSRLKRHLLSGGARFFYSKAKTVCLDALQLPVFSLVVAMKDLQIQLSLFLQPLFLFAASVL
jgi:hypothetical protein